MVQLRGEPTTTANLSKGECSPVRVGVRGGDKLPLHVCVSLCVCVCIGERVYACVNVIPSNLAVQNPGSTEAAELPGSRELAFLARL